MVLILGVIVFIELTIHYYSLLVVSGQGQWPLYCYVSLFPFCIYVMSCTVESVFRVVLPAR